MTNSAPSHSGVLPRSAVGLAWIQGAFYFVSGLWPLLHLASFLAVTGPKVDLWLVQTVGGLLAVTGAGLLLAARRKRVTAEWAVVAAGQATVLAISDVATVARGVISRIYLADAVVEAVIVAAWIAVAWRSRRGR